MMFLSFQGLALASRAALFGAVSLSAGLAAAVQPATLVDGGAATITSADMQADSMRMPPEMRNIVLSDVRKVSQIAQNLYVRRALAEQAVKAGLDQNPSTAAEAKIARDRVLSDAMIAQMDQRNTPSDKVVEALARDAYAANPDRYKKAEQVHTRHILLSKEGPEARAKAEAVLAKVRAGANFAELAKQQSIDTGSAEKGGDLGFFEAGRMVPEFDVAAFALSKPGQVSDLVESKFGFHIIELIEKKPAGRLPFDEAKETLMQDVRNKAIQEARLKEVEKIQDAGKPNAAAMEAYAAQYEAKRDQPKQ